MIGGFFAIIVMLLIIIAVGVGIIAYNTRDKDIGPLTLMDLMPDPRKMGSPPGVRWGPAQNLDPTSIKSDTPPKGSTGLTYL